MSPLANSEYTVTSTKDFIEKIKNLKVPDGHQLISFDVKSLFTNVPLEKTIDIILKRIYGNEEINTSISKKDMKDTLMLCTKNVHFSMNGDIYLKIDGVAMGSPLGPILAGIFMVELGRSLVPKLSNYIKFWKRFVDDTITFANIEAIDHILTVLNSFDPNIQFTYEAEKKSKLSFLDVMLCRKDNKFVCSVYKKSTNSDIFMNWHSFAPKTWKIGTLKSLIERAFLICSTEELLNEELKHLEKVFREKNHFPKWVIRNVMNDVKNKHQRSDIKNPISIDNNMPVEKIEQKRHLLILPYQGDRGNSLVKSLQKRLHNLLPNHINTQVTYTGKKLSTCFNIKEQTKCEHQHDIVYYGKCPEVDCTDNYIGEASRRVSERIIDHNGRDRKSHFFRHSVKHNHKNVERQDFKILGKGYRNNSMKQKISEALYCRELKPTLNVQEKSIDLKLFS